MTSNCISIDTHFYDSHLQQVITTKKDINEDEKKKFLKIIIRRNKIEKGKSKYLIKCSILFIKYSRSSVFHSFN